MLDNQKIIASELPDDENVEYTADEIREINLTLEKAIKGVRQGKVVPHSEVQEKLEKFLGLK